ncbi:hypothetical protein D3C87_1598160 [compost metagenome]
MVKTGDALRLVPETLFMVALGGTLSGSRLLMTATAVVWALITIEVPDVLVQAPPVQIKKVRKRATSLPAALLLRPRLASSR